MKVRKSERKKKDRKWEVNINKKNGRSKIMNQLNRTENQKILRKKSLERKKKCMNE